MNTREIYTISDVFDRTSIIDAYGSWVYTQRVSDYSDATIIGSSNHLSFVPGDIIEYNNEYLICESVKRSGNTITATFISVFGFLKYRIFRRTFLKEPDKWTNTMKPTMFVKNIIDWSISNTGGTASYMVLPSGKDEVLPIQTITSFDDDMEEDNISVGWGNVYGVVKPILDGYDLDIRFYSAVAGYIQCVIYPLPKTPITAVFDENADTFIRDELLNTMADRFTTLYVFPTDITPDAPLVGMSRINDSIKFRHRTTYTDSDGFNDDNLHTNDDIKRKLDAVAKINHQDARPEFLNSGSVPEYSPLRYMADYQIGSLVNVRSDGFDDLYRIVEYTVSIDPSSETAYPTLEKVIV